MILAVVVHHRDRCSLILRTHQMRFVRRSWEIEIDGRSDDSLRRGCETDFGENRNVDCDVGCESGALVNEIFPSVNC